MGWLGKEAKPAADKHIEHRRQRPAGLNWWSEYLTFKKLPCERTNFFTIENVFLLTDTPFLIDQLQKQIVYFAGGGGGGQK